MTWFLAIVGLTLAALCAAAVRMLLGAGKRSRPKAGSTLDYEHSERVHMPAEIADGRLVISEKTLRHHGAKPFFAKTDQIFLTPSGLLVPVETKARGWVSSSDIVQLSAQSIAAASQPGNRHRPADWGYVRLAPPGRSPIYQRVKLITKGQVYGLWDRWHALKRGQVAPLARPKPGRCKHCGYRASCPVASRT